VGLERRMGRELIFSETIVDPLNEVFGGRPRAFCREVTNAPNHFEVNV
jgi:hypothetical protein